MKNFNVKRTFALAASALALSSAFVGCSDYSEFTEGLLNNLKNQKEYDEAFVEKFGQIDPNQDWGMNEEIGAIPGPMITRAASGLPSATVEVNLNQWTEFSGMSDVTLPDYGTGAPTIKVPNFTGDKYGVFGHDYLIPGFPHLNGLYYLAKGGVEDNYYEGTEIHSGDIPAGDVTPFEIQYVSNWFRTHKNPKSNVTLHLSDFFVQNISWDADQVDYKTSGYNTYNGWPSTGNNGSNVASKEDALGKNKTDNTGGFDKDGNPVSYATGLNENINYALEHLGFKDMDGNWFHINNFNSGNSNFSPEDKASNPNREIKFVRSSGTEDFRCRPSWGTGDQGDGCDDNSYINSWVLVHLTWNETVKHIKSPYAQNTVIPREGYYLAFDFHANKNNGSTVVNRDGYYSNWIIKITPAHFNPSGHARRIFCEDLGGSLDFDFNDAVVDVAFEQVGEKYQPIISVQAAGGTMPICIEQDDHNDKYEMHRMLDASTTTPVNVDDKTSHAPAIYRSKNLYEHSNPGQIKIVVHNTKNGEKYTITGANADPNDNERTESMKDLATYESKNNAPRAFATPINVKWPIELTNISKPYTDFKKWVAKKDYVTSAGKKWYEIETNAAEYLYTSRINMDDDSPTSPGSGQSADIWNELTPAGDVATIVAGVKADSYMKLTGYTGPDGILSNLDKRGNDAIITFVVVLSSNTLYNNSEINNLVGVLTPADISGTTMSYKGTSFTAQDMINANRFNIAEHVVANDGEFKDDGHAYTYTLQFSFTKDQLKKANGNYHDYLLLFLKVGNYNPATGDHGVKVQKWYAHY